MAYIIKSFNSHDKCYKYFIPGLVSKIIGVILFSLIYLFYYGGGDTLNYFYSAKAITYLFFNQFDIFLKIVFTNDLNWDYYAYFNKASGWPQPYMWKDSNTFSVCRFKSIFQILSMNSFFVTGFFTACFSYIGIWKFYKLINDLYPGNLKIFSVLILFYHL